MKYDLGAEDLFHKIPHECPKIFLNMCFQNLMYENLVSVQVSSLVTECTKVYGDKIQL